MNPVVFQVGPLILRSFTAWIALAVLVSLVVVLARAAQRGERLTPYIDVLLAGISGGAVGARAFHVWLNRAYFSTHTDEIVRFTSGGLDWHGAIIVGLIAMTIAALVRRISLAVLFDTLALMFGIGTAAGWIASVSANGLYGVEVRTLADFPAWLVTESPDVYSTIAPRINLLPIGLMLSALVVIVAVVLTLLRKFSGSRLLLLIAIFSIGMGLIGFFRLDYSPEWLGRRGDQVLDFGLALVAILLFGIVALWRVRAASSKFIREGNVHVEHQV
jgi:prolipoprotein diacylglyceryltransferase